MKITEDSLSETMILSSSDEVRIASVFGDLCMNGTLDATRLTPGVSSSISQVLRAAILD